MLCLEVAHGPLGTPHGLISGNRLLDDVMQLWFCSTTLRQCVMSSCAAFPRAQDSGTFCLAGSGQCAGEWTVKPQTDIEGHDLDCNAKDSKVRHWFLVLGF